MTLAHAQELRRAIDAAPRITLPNIAAQLWRSYGEGHVTEAEAEALGALIETRQTLRTSDRESDSQNAPIAAVNPRKAVGSRPRTDASMERRRRWAASGRMPPAIAARFTLAEQAVLSLIAAETCRRKDCRLAIDHMAAVAGVSRSTVKNAIREAVRLGLITVEERQITGWRNDTNIVCIVSPEWLAWLRLTRRRKDESTVTISRGGGVKTVTGTPTKILDSGKTKPTIPLQKLPRGSGRPDRKRTEWKHSAG